MQLIVPAISAFAYHCLGPYELSSASSSTNCAAAPQLVISEWGVGGGTQDGGSIAKSTKDVAGAGGTASGSPQSVPAKRPQPQRTALQQQDRA
jgi:hypothetical protein